MRKGKTYSSPGYGRRVGNKSGGSTSRPGGGKANGKQKETSIGRERRGGNYDASNGRMRKSMHRTGMDRRNGTVPKQR